jgi:hypothetical protein
MVRAQPRTTRRAAARAAVPAVHASAANAAGNGADEVSAIDTEWARGAFNTCLLQAQNLFRLLQAMQEAQARALQDASFDIGHALEEIEAADDAQAFSAAASHLFNAQCQHAMANASSTAGRMLEIEADWLRKTQAQAAERLSALGGGATASAPVVAHADSADDSARAWQQWAAQWQDGMSGMSRAWTEALQPRA